MEEKSKFFRKNDIITIISEKDEHCWVGEVNGLRGWFPAKFVEAREQSNITISQFILQVVDERGKDYTIYGDEAVSPEITEYIRGRRQMKSLQSVAFSGRLANSFRQIMDHGIRESILYANTAYHPWAFIGEIKVLN